jgi:hypothetical protein
VGLLTKDQVDEIWERKGLRFRAKRFRKYLISMGLGPMTVSEDVFLRHIHDEFLINFFVKGVREDARGRQEFPSDEPNTGSKGASEGKHAERGSSGDSKRSSTCAPEPAATSAAERSGGSVNARVGRATAPRITQPSISVSRGDKS